MAPNGVPNSWATAPMTASTLKSLFVRSRRSKVMALASREYKNIVSTIKTVNNMQLPSRTKQRAAYQPTVNRTELLIIATKQFGMLASKVAISHKSRIVRLRRNRIVSAIAPQDQSAKLT
jgi:hypothetical protein